MVELIAEVSSNHGGDIELAKAFIYAYAEAGADWVKFQSYQVATLRPDDPQREWLAKAELSDEAHYILKETCEKAGTKFLTTVFHHSRVPFLMGLGLDTLKIGSGEAGEKTLAETLLMHGLSRVIVSCGLYPPARHAIGWAWAHQRIETRPSRIDSLHCVSRYPAPVHMADSDYRTYQGWSDHCVGLDGCTLAYLKGANILEKHVSLPEQTREKRSFEATVAEFRALRAFVDDDPKRYVGRWQSQPLTQSAIA